MIIGHKLPHFLKTCFIKEPWECDLVNFSLFLTLLRILVKKVNSGVFTLPDGIAMTIHRMNGSTHTAFGTLMALWATKKLTSNRSPQRIPSDGMLRALPICLQP